MGEERRDVKRISCLTWTPPRIRRVRSSRLTTMCKRRIGGSAKDFTAEQESLAADYLSEAQLVLGSDVFHESSLTFAVQRRRMNWDEVRRILGAYVDQALVAQAISNHVRSLMAADLAAVNSSDEHSVKAWFTWKLDYSPPVVDLAEAGFPLIGGRIDMLDQRPVAAIVYQHGNHLINLFVWPVASRKIDLDVQFDRGYRFCGWNKAGLNYFCISEGSAITLEEFEDEVRERTNL
jgi:hypothetical protein